MSLEELKDKTCCVTVRTDCFKLITQEKMNRMRLFLMLAGCLPGFTSNSLAKPNILVILTDDQGCADAGFQGFPASKDVLTPNLDQLAASGIVFHSGYTAF